MAGSRKRKAPRVSRSSNMDTADEQVDQNQEALTGRGKFAIWMEMPIEIFLEVSCRSFLASFSACCITEGKGCAGF